MYISTFIENQKEPLCTLKAMNTKTPSVKAIKEFFFIPETNKLPYFIKKLAANPETRQSL